MLVRTRNGIAAVAITAATAAGGLIDATPAHAATSYDGYCKDSTGTTVVVDFRQLGGGIAIRCATAPLSGGGTGLSALQGAGIPITGTQRYGDAFICRLYNKPSVSQSLPIAGNPSYKERCLNTPPTAAHWSYWYANNGASWVSSSVGVGSHTAIRGGFEGWSFTLNSGDAPPRVAPTRPKPAVAPKPPAAPRPPAKSNPPAKPSPKPKSGSSPSSSSSAAGTPGSKPGAPGSATTGPGGPSSTTGSKSPSGTSSSGKSPSGTSSSGKSSSGKSSSGPSSPSSSSTANGSTSARGPSTSGGAPIANSNQLAAQATAQESSGSSINLPTVLGAGLLAVLGIAGGGVLAYRRFR